MNTTALWLIIVALGMYHGVNPAMGWPLAVANGMTTRRASSLFATLLPLGSGHFLAMAVVLVPFAWLGWHVDWTRAIRLGAGAAVLLFGCFRLLNRRHPRRLARIPPTRLVLLSFLMATAHGAGLMLVPFMLELCVAAAPGSGTGGASAAQAGHALVMAYLARSSFTTAVLVAAVHTSAGILAGIGMAWAVYRYFGLYFVRQAWINLDVVWAASLVLAGAAGIALAI